MERQGKHLIEDRITQSGRTKKSKRVPADCGPSGSKPVASSDPFYSFRDEPTEGIGPIDTHIFIEEQRALNGPCGIIYCARDTESPTERFEVLQKKELHNKEEGFFPTRSCLLMKCVDGNIPSIHKVFVKKSLDKALLPPVIWAQRNSVIFVTIELEDCKNPIIEIEPKQIIFHSFAGLTPKVYEVTIPLFRVIEPERTTVSIGGRCIELVLQKTSSDTEYWPRLTRESMRNHWLKIDFDKWKEQDDSGDKSSVSGDESNVSDKENVAAVIGRTLRFLHPIKWAQRDSMVFITICAEEFIPLYIKFKPDQIIFYCIGGLPQKLYGLTIPLFGVIKPENSRSLLRGKYVEFIMQKPSSDTKYWPYLIKEKKKSKDESDDDKDESDDDSDIEGVTDCIRRMKGDAYDNSILNMIKNTIHKSDGPEVSISDLKEDVNVKYLMEMIEKTLQYFGKSEISTRDLKKDPYVNNVLKMMKNTVCKFGSSEVPIGDLDLKKKKSKDDSNNEAVAASGRRVDVDADIYNIVKKTLTALYNSGTTEINISDLKKDANIGNVINIKVMTLYNFDAKEINIRHHWNSSTDNIFKMMKSTDRKSGGPEVDISVIRKYGILNYMLRMMDNKTEFELGDLEAILDDLGDLEAILDDLGEDFSEPYNESSNNEEMSELAHTDRCKETSHKNQKKKVTEETVTRRSKRPIKSVIRMNL